MFWSDLKFFLKKACSEDFLYSEGSGTETYRMFYKFRFLYKSLESGYFDTGFGKGGYIRLIDETISVFWKYASKLDTRGTDKNKALRKYMQGRYYVFLLETTEPGEKRESRVASARTYFEEALECSSHIPATAVLRLRICLHASVFYYEIGENHERAILLAKQAFDDAIAELDTLPEETYKISTQIMQLIRDNLTIWTTS